MKSTVRKRNRLLALALCLALAAMVANATASPWAFDDGEAAFHAQGRQVVAADRIQQLAASANLAGFAGTLIDDARRSVRLYWKGGLPAPMASLISAIRATGDKVDVKPAAFSLAELDVEARRIGGLSSDATGVQITGIGPTEDYSALVVSISRAEDLEHAHQTVTSPYPLQFDVMPEPGQGVWDRWHDFEPFYAGGHIQNSVAGCTTGWALKTATGAERLLTARHCGQNVAWYTVDGLYVGTSASGSASRDANAMSGKDYSATVFLGPWNSSSSKPVGSSGNPSDEQMVFVSGASSGYSAVRVKDINKYAVLYGVTIGPGFWTLDEQHDGSIGQGDSGGPVGNNNSATNKIVARGMFSLYDKATLAPCVGLGERQCSYHAFHINIASIASSLAMTVQTQ